MEQPIVTVLTTGTTRDYDALYKIKVLKANIPFAEQVTEPDTKYVIKWNFDLNDEIVTVPENCILEFDGGSLSNGSLIGNETCVIYSTPIFDNIIIDGTWNIPVIYSWIFKDIEEEDKLRELFKLCSDTIENDVYIEKTDNPYIIVPKDNAWYSVTGISIPSFTTIHNTGSIKVKPNGDYRYCIFAIEGTKKNIVIDGGEYIGDNYDGEHDYSDQTRPTHEWGYAMWSYRGSEFITIKNIHAHNFTGDFMELNSANVIIDNIIIHDNRRQGISLCDCYNVNISNFEVYNINGTNPQSAFDIEPNNINAYDIVIENGYIHDCLRGLVCSNSNHTIKNITYRNITIKDVARAIRHFTATDCTYDNIRMIDIIGEQPAGSSVNACCLFTECENVQLINSYLKTKDTSNAESLQIGSDIYISNCIFIGTGLSSSSRGYIDNCILTFKGLIVANIVKNSIITLYKETGSLTLAGTLENCKITIKSPANLYDTYIKNCIIDIDSALSNQVFYIMNNTNIKIIDTKLNIGNNNTLIKNVFSGSFVQFINCEYKLGNNISIGSNLVNVFFGYSTTSELNNLIPSILDKGKPMLNTTTGKMMFWNDSWKDALGYEGGRNSGTTDQRPVFTDLNDGYMFFDKTLGKPIFSLAGLNNTPTINENVGGNSTQYVSTEGLVTGKKYKFTKDRMGIIGIYFINDAETQYVNIIDTASQTEAIVTCPDISIYTKIRMENRGNFEIVVKGFDIIYNWVDATGATV